MGKMSRSAAWKALDLLEDFVSGGFARRDRGILEDAEAVDSGRGSPDPGPAEAPKPAARAMPAGNAAATGDRAEAISAIAREIESCAACALSLNRKKAVPGEGILDPLVLIVGEGPGEEEDASGRPFVGNSGKYLGTWLSPIGLSRERCFISNCVKCRPPQNREPHPDELAACMPFLERQIEVLRPKTILCLGRIAAHDLLGTSASLASLRSRIHRFKDIPLVVTYHPSAVLRDPSLRRPVWEDLKMLKTLL